MYYITDIFYPDAEKYLPLFFLSRLKRTATGTCSMGCGQRGQGNFELATNCDYIHEGRLPLAKVSVSVGS